MIHAYNPVILEAEAGGLCIDTVILGYKVRPCEREKGEREARLVKREGEVREQGGGAGAHMHKCEYRGASTDFAMFVFLASSD